jgi:integrase/recombinase XerC
MKDFLAIVQGEKMDILAQLEQHINRRVARGAPTEHTRRVYRMNARMYLEWCVERGLEPDAATEEDVVDYRAALIARGYSPATLATKLHVVRVLYEALGRRDDNPARYVYAPVDHTPDEESISRLTPAQSRAVLEAVDAADNPHRVRDGAMLRILLFLGLRGHELCALDLKDVQDGRLVVRRGKGRRRRTLYLTEGLAEALAAWLVERQAAAHETALFVNLVDGGRLGTGGLRKIVNGYLRRAGVKTLGKATHLLRHTACTLAFLGGAELVDVQRMAGHSDPRTTSQYIHIIQAEQRNPARVIEALVGVA